MSVESIFVSDVGLAWDQRAPLLLRQRAEGEVAPPRLAHLTAHEYVANKYVPEAMFRDYMTFSVVRDPFARVVSLYRYMGFHRMMSFDRFVASYLPKVLGDRDHSGRWFVRPQADFITSPSGEVIVDHLVRLEDIDAQLPAVLSLVGLDVDAVPHVNKQDRLRRRRMARLRFAYVLRERSLPALPGERHPVWTDRLRASVADSYGDDFRILGYAAQ